MSSVEQIDGEYWRTQAACQGEFGSLFYPPLRTDKKSAKSARVQRAKAVCEGCPVRTDCLDHAVRSGERHGVWGGLTDVERQHLRSA